MLANAQLGYQAQARRQTEGSAEPAARATIWHASCLEFRRTASGPARHNLKSFEALNSFDRPSPIGIAAAGRHRRPRHRP
jgi:hypothetical protein